MFLIWWYTNGLLVLLQRLREHLLDLVRALSLKLLFRYLFVPMYGYYDIWSRVISFGVRLVHFLFLFIYTLLYLAIEILVVVFWCLLPLFVLINLLYQLQVLW